MGALMSCFGTDDGYEFPSGREVIVDKKLAEGGGWVNMSGFSICPQTVSAIARARRGRLFAWDCGENSHTHVPSSHRLLVCVSGQGPVGQPIRAGTFVLCEFALTPNLRSVPGALRVHMMLKHGNPTTLAPLCPQKRLLLQLPEQEKVLI